MFDRTCKLAVAMTLAVLAPGCTRPEPIVLDTTGIEVAVDYSDLAAVLDKVVTKDGLLIPKALEDNCEQLDRQLKRLVVTGPTVTPQMFATEADRIAYWYNARAAWSMKLAMLSEFPDRLHSCDLVDRPFPLDGREMSLAAIDELLTTKDDWRVVVAAPGVSLCRARLPAEPVTSEGIEGLIADRFNQFIDDRQRFVIDVSQKRILVPRVLWRSRKRIIAHHGEEFGAAGANLVTALLPYVDGSPHRRLQDAIGYATVPAGEQVLIALLNEGL